MDGLILETYPEDLGGFYNPQRYKGPWLISLIYI